MDYQVQRTPCPQCGDNSQVHTARELFDMLNGANQTAFQRFSQAGNNTAGNNPAGGNTGGNNAGGPPPGPGGFHAAPFQTPGGNDITTPAPGQGGNSPTSAPPPGQAWPAADQQAWPAAGQDQGQAWPPAQQGHPNDGNYDHYSAEGPDRSLRGNWNRVRRGDNVADDIGDAVLGAALGFAGRTIGRRMKKAFEEKVLPAMEARAKQAQGQSQQQSEQSKAEQDAIVARYPELRSCAKDQVVFLDGGYKTVPFSELAQPVTLAQADAIVARLR